MSQGVNSKSIVPHIVKICNHFFLPLIIFIFFFIWYQQIYQLAPIRYWDEHDWIARGYFLELYLNGDFNNPLWESLDSIEQPKLQEYIYGAILYPDYIKEKKRIII